MSTMKGISFLLHGKKVSVTFNYTFFRGITDVMVFTGAPDSKILGLETVEIIQKTPSARERAKEAIFRWRIILPEGAKRKFYKQ